MSKDVMPGGWGPVTPATEETQKLIDKVRAEAENKAAQKFEEYLAVEYSEQVVAGTNYRVKVNIGGGKSVTLCIFLPLPVDGSVPVLTDLKFNQ